MTNGKVGRPAKKHWQPVKLMEVQGKDPNYTYKWCRSAIMDARKLEGWEPCHASTEPELRTGSGVKDDLFVINDSGQSMILCRMPMSMKVEREQYYEDKIVNRTRAAKDQLREVVEKAGPGYSYVDDSEKEKE